MKLSATAVGTFLVLAATTTFQSAEAFAGLRPSPSPLSLQRHHSAFVPSLYQSKSPVLTSPTSLQMSYSVGIVGATGAVGKEIRQVLENRNFPVSKLRIFGSERSAGSTIATEKYGDVKVELFDVAKARECDVVFLAVSGDFALEHAEAISAGDDGAVVIDNSVSKNCGMHARFEKITSLGIV
jgi:Semialdehyde dehydrogenase, NAD binding domain